MTAIAAIASGARGRMIVDSASYTPDGVMVGHVAKAVPLAHLGTVFATRGATTARWAVAEELEAFASFDAIVTGAAGTLREAHEDGAFGGDLDVVLMGWSTAGRRVELYTLSTVAHGGVPPFTLQAMAITLAPLPDDNELRRIGLKISRSWDLSRTAEKLRHVIEAQREMTSPLGAALNAPAGRAIGGAVIVTELSEAGITQHSPAGRGLLSFSGSLRDAGRAGEACGPEEGRRRACEARQGPQAEEGARGCRGGVRPLPITISETPDRPARSGKYGTAQSSPKRSLCPGS